MWLRYQNGPDDLVWTDEDGRYVHAKGSGPVDIKIELEGFEAQTRRTTVGPETTEDFALVATRPPNVSLTGEWAVTFHLASRCRSVLPAIAHSRSYDATIHQEDAQVVITFRSPTLDMWPDVKGRFVALGSIDRNTLSFVIPSDTFWDGYLSGYFIDHLTEAEHLTVGLGGSGVVRANEVTVTMNGGAQYDAGGHPGNAYCEAPDHRFEFRRK